MTPVALGTIAGALLGLLVPRARSWTELRLDPHTGRISLKDLNRSDTVRCDDVRFVCGEGGVNLDGGEMIVWKRLWLHTEAQRHAVKLGAAGNAACYRDLLQACPQAVGLSYTGEVNVPSGADRSVASMRYKLEHSLALGRAELLRQAVRALAAAGVAFLLGLAGIVVVILAVRKGIPMGEEAAWPIVSCVIGLLFVARAVRRAVRVRRMRMMLEGYRREGLRPTSARAHGLTSPQSD